MKVSIIVPVYNVEQYLKKCLDSLVNQTLKDIEVIVVNDGSTDKSKEIVDEYVKKYSDKVILYTKKNEGQAVARNFALKKAKGEYVMFVDSDDWIALDMCEKLYNEAIIKNAAIVCCNYYKVEDDKLIKEICSESSEKDVLKRYITTQAGPWKKLIKREIIIENDLFFPKLRAYEDIAVVPSYGLFSENISFIDDPLYYYLIRDGSTMNQLSYNDKLEHIFPSLDNLYHIFCKNGYEEKYREELEWIYIEHLLHGASLRFFQFKNYKSNIDKINNVMKNKFPQWRKNKYYKKTGLKYKIICNLFNLEQFLLLKMLLRHN